MMFDVIYHAGQLMLQTAINVYVSIVCLRILLHWANVSYANPILLAVARITTPCLKPIYSIIPTVNGLDLAAIVLLSLLSMFKIAALFWLQTGYIPFTKGLFILAFSEVLMHFINIFTASILLFIAMSWFHPLAAPALFEIVLKIGGPLLRLGQKIAPPISNIDFSPFLVIVGLELFIFFIVTPLSQIGLTMIKSTLTTL